MYLRMYNAIVAFYERSKRASPEEVFNTDIAILKKLNPGIHEYSVYYFFLMSSSFFSLLRHKTPPDLFVLVASPILVVFDSGLLQVLPDITQIFVI